MKKQNKSRPKFFENWEKVAEDHRLQDREYRILRWIGDKTNYSKWWKISVRDIVRALDGSVCHASQHLNHLAKLNYIIFYKGRKARRSSTLRLSVTLRVTGVTPRVTNGVTPRVTIWPRPNTILKPFSNREREFFKKKRIEDLPIKEAHLLKEALSWAYQRSDYPPKMPPASFEKLLLETIRRVGFEKVDKLFSRSENPITFITECKNL